MPYHRIIDRLSLSALSEESRAKTCGYWFTLTSYSTPETAFETRAQLIEWAAAFGLSLGEIPREGERPGSLQISGEYGRALCSRREWDAIEPDSLWLSLDNGQYTLGKLARDSEHGRVVEWVMNPNVPARPVFDYRAARAQAIAGAAGNPLALPFASGWAILGDPMAQPFPRIAAKGERLTYWEVSPGVFNCFVPASGGYGSPDVLAKLKGDSIVWRAPHCPTAAPPSPDVLDSFLASLAQTIAAGESLSLGGRTYGAPELRDVLALLDCAPQMAAALGEWTREVERGAFLAAQPVRATESALAAWAAAGGPAAARR